MKKSLLNNAMKIAQEKLHTHPQLSNFPHYSFVIQNNQIIEWAPNTAMEPPRHYGYHRTNDTGFKPKYHSETLAYKRARGLISEKDFEMINIRLNKKGEIRLSKPCKPCFELMSALGCRYFYYSSEVGFLKLAGEN